MGFLGRLFFWFVGECLDNVFSQAIAESVSKNPWVYYSVWALIFSGVSVGLTVTFFWTEIKEFL